MMWINCKTQLPPPIPDEDDFGIEYEIEYRLPNGKTEKTITEWLYDNTWNCIYPVIRWKEVQKVIPFKRKELP